MMSKEFKEKIVRELILITREHGSVKAHEKMTDLFVDNPRQRTHINEVENLMAEIRWRLKQQN
jgi:hypothetical protein